MSSLHICPLSKLRTTLAQSGARHMISLAGPGKTEPRPAQITGAYLALEFNDIAEPQEGLIAPSPNDVSSLINFFDNWVQTEPVVIHCWMGISRSTAAALIGLAFLNREADMISLARRLREESRMATPNPMMIEIADSQMNLDGRLVEAVKLIGRGAYAPEGWPFVLETRNTSP